MTNSTSYWPKASSFTFYCNSASRVLDEIEPYVNSFAQNGIVVFKDAYFSEYDVLRILTKMGKQLGWTPNQPGSEYETETATPDSNHRSWKHVIRHAERVEELELRGENFPTTQIIQWHLDGVAAEFQHYAAGWNMQKFTCSQECGSSGFVDMQEILFEVPNQYMSLLERSQICHLPIMRGLRTGDPQIKIEFAQLIKSMNSPVWVEYVDSYISAYPRPAIGIHPATGREVLRTDPTRAPWGIQEFLFSVDDRPPTEHEYELFDNYLYWLDSYMHNMGDEFVYWHQWGPGDFIVPDLFRMLHGVRGGFRDGERIFNAYWCFPHGTPADNELRISIEEYEAVSKARI